MFASLKPTFIYFLRPIELFRGYSTENLRFDLIAGLTVTVILLPQAIAFALIVEVPPSMGLYTAIIGAIAGALWGSSSQMHTGPTNALSLLILAVLLSLGIQPGGPDFLAAVGVMAVMVGVFQVAMGLARLGLLVNFVSDSVIVGFTAGAGVLIMVNQLRHLLGLSIESSPELMRTLELVTANLPYVHTISLLFGGATIVLLLLFKRVAPKWPGLLISMIILSAIGAVFGLDQYGLKVIGELPRNFPPLARLPLFDLDLVGPPVYRRAIRGRHWVGSSHIDCPLYRQPSGPTLRQQPGVCWPGAGEYCQRLFLWLCGVRFVCTFSGQC